MRLGGVVDERKKKGTTVIINGRPVDSLSSGVYIPKKKQAKRTGSAGKAPAASPRLRAKKRSQGISSASRGSSDAGSLIGGMKASGIRAKAHVTSTPNDPELTQEERRMVWQPPKTDKSRFDGSNASRHSASSSYKDPSDYSLAPYADASSPDEKYGPATRRRKKKKNKTNKTTARRTANRPNAAARKQGKKAAANVIKTGPLSDKEIGALDKTYRVWGGYPEMKGWDNGFLPGRSRAFLFAEVRRLKLYLYDDSRWTPAEARVFALNRNSIDRASSLWSTLLPRKSAAAIVRAYGVAVPDVAGLAKGAKRRAYAEFGVRLGQVTG